MKNVTYNTVKLNIVKTVKTSFKGNPMFIKIRLSDDCNNGHNDFAITGDIYTSVRGRIPDNNEDYKQINGKWHRLDTCGCIHEEILKVKPSLKIFVDLHLSDENGEPMYALENGYYHLEGVQGIAAYDHKCTLENFAEYIRIDLTEAQKLVDTCHNKIDFALYLDTLRPIWKEQANQAKELLLSMS